MPPEDIVAVGGRLTPERVIHAYRCGIFPWPHDDYPMLWFSPDPRYVIPVDEFHIPSNVQRLIKKQVFTCTLNQSFDAVINACRQVPRPDQEGTWITDEIVEVYTELSQRGIAFSVETWQGDNLVGGLYGIKTQNVFCGESMFTLKSGAGKCALVHLAHWLSIQNTALIDCQMQTPLMEMFGGRFIPRADYLAILQR